MTAAALAAAMTIGVRPRSGGTSEADLPANWRNHFNIVGAVQAVAIALAVLAANQGRS